MEMEIRILENINYKANTYEIVTKKNDVYVVITRM